MPCIVSSWLTEKSGLMVRLAVSLDCIKFDNLQVDKFSFVHREGKESDNIYVLSRLPAMSRMGRDGRNEDTGHQETKKELTKAGFLGLPEAPVFYPTEEEFADPFIYIEQIRQEAETYGICRIVPPKTWKPPFAIDVESFSFPTKLQPIHHLQMRSAACDAETFNLEYSRFLEKEGRKLEGWPLFSGKELDLCKLFSAVKRHGGYKKVVREKKWGEVLQILDPSCGPIVQSTSLLSLLCQMYEIHLYNYEVYQSKFSCGKRYRTFNVQEETSKHRGKKSGRQFAEEEILTVGDFRLGVHPKIEKDFVEEIDPRADQVCEQCHSGAHEQLMLLCDRCDRGWHLYCLTPPLAAVPSGNWYCFDCLASETESFGFTPGLVHDLESFRRVADRFKKKWFNLKEANCSEIEEEFWSVVERNKGPVEVLYGSDLATETYGSGFPRSSDPVPGHVDDALWKQYAASPWNLNNFAKLKDSLLKHVEENIPGVTVPWVYVGMLFSSFCWHYEDQCFYSINYLHWGEPKCWYSVPGSAVNAFEQVMHKTFPDLFEAQPDLLFQLITMLNPKVLRENDVPVCTTIQERGNFVITFPRSYHGGFNHGFNCAEAVNFATADWLPFGRFGVERARLYHKAAVLSHEELLYVVAKDTGCQEISPWVKKELQHTVSLERKQREQLWKGGVVRNSRMTPRKFPEVIGPEEDSECIICRYYLFLSALTCSCCPGRAVCLQHSEQLCECSMDQQQLLYRYSLAELDDLLEIQPSVSDNSSSFSESIRGKQKRRCRQIDSTTVMKKVNGSMVSHTKLAEMWLMNAESVLCTTAKISSIETLLIEAEQFLWAGHEMDPVRLVERDLRSAQSWAKGVVGCLSAAAGATSEKTLLATARQLLGVNPAPCDLKDSIVKLKAAVETAIELQQQAKGFLSTSPPWQLRELESLQQELLQSPLKFPESERLEDIVSSAQAWGEKVRTLLLQPRMSWSSGQRNVTDIAKLRALQFKADKLSVLLPEMKILDAFISKLEKWQEQAKKLLEVSAPLEVVKEFLFEIENVPVYFPEADILEQRIYEANEWRKCACKVLADVHQQTYYNASMELLSALLRTGELLQIKVTEVDLVKAELKKVSWLERAAKGLQSQLTSKDLMDILEEANRLSLQNEKIYLELQSVVDAAQLWEHKAVQYLEKGACLDDYRTLRRDSAKIYASLSGWVGINIGIMQAESFLHRAQPFLNRNLHASSVFDLGTLQELVIESHNLKVNLSEIHLLSAAHDEVISWSKRAANLIQYAKEVLRAAQPKDVFYTDLELDREKTKIVSENNELLTNLKKMVDEGKGLGFDLPEAEELQILVMATEWNLKAIHSLFGCPTMQEVKSLVQEASTFSDYVGQLKLLQSALSRAKHWSEKSKHLLQRRDPDSKCTHWEVEELLTEAKGLQICVSSDAAHLEELLTSHKEWQNQILKYLFSPDQPISWEELNRLQEIGKISPIKSDVAEALANEVVNVERWLSNCRAKVLGNPDLNCVALTDVFTEVQISVDNSLQKIQNRTNMETEELCHFCRKELDSSNSSLLKCDNCNDRYHSSCLGWKQSHVRAQKQFVCCFCNAFRSGVLWHDEEVLSKVCMTRRPTIGALQELLDAAKAIRIRMEEIELLHAIVQRVQAWRTCLHDIVEPILHQYTNQTHSSAVLLFALKLAGTMEVQEDEDSNLALAISVNAWRMRAKTLLESQTKPLHQTFCHVLKEGLAIPTLSHDCFLRDLRRWEIMVSEWGIRAKKAVEDNGTTPLEDVYKLIVEYERLPVALDKELAALKSRTVLYCICRKPYDKERAMIACDCCSEWYHFDCVDLPEPDSSDDECEDMLQRYGSAGEFLCPNCKNLETGDTSRLIKELVQESGRPLMKDGSNVDGSYYTPPFWHARGKRSNRASLKVRADVQERWRSHSNLSNCAKVVAKETDCSQTCPSNTGRPCRRTAGQHSKFESFVLLMHSG